MHPAAVGRIAPRKSCGIPTCASPTLGFLRKYMSVTVGDGDASKQAWALP
jgi:hypothetical protein